MNLQNQIKDSFSLLDATKAFYDWRGVLALVGTGAVAALVFIIFSAMGPGNIYLMGTGAILSAGICFYGFNAVGIQNLYHAKSSPISFTGAISLSLGSSHRLILVGLLAWLVGAGVLLTIGLLLFLCKIPYLGPILLTVVTPIGSILIGLGAFFFGYIFYPMAAPAIWSGESTSNAFRMVLAIAKKNLLSVVIKMLLLTLFVSIISGIVYSVIGAGSLIMTTVSTSFIGGYGAILGSGLSLNGLMYGLLGGGSGNMLAVTLGNGALFLAISSALLMVMIRGLCIIYLSSSEDCESISLQSLIPSVIVKGVEETRKVVSQAQQQLTHDRKCSKCHAKIGADDHFCGECGEPQ